MKQPVFYGAGFPYREIGPLTGKLIVLEGNDGVGRSTQIKMLRRWLEAEGVSALDACLRYVLSVPEVDKVVFGVDSVDQLRQILGAASGGLSSLPLWPQAIDLNLINPALWSQL